MSGLAKILLHNGCYVSGSDMRVSNITQDLEHAGIDVKLGHSADNINSTIDLVIYTGAISTDNCELVMAKKLCIPTIERSELLGLISKQFDHVIAVSGTHGKTTTTAMIGEIFIRAGLDPTIHLGGKSIGFNSNTRIGSSSYFILEACEYRNSFRYVHPECAIILNIENDHLDYYKDDKEIKLAFDNFASQSKSIITSEHYNVRHNNLININDYRVVDLKILNQAYQYDVYYQNKFIMHIRLNTIGLHNVQNSLYAIAIARQYGIDSNVIANALGDFCGVERRYENIGTIRNVPVIIDYAHHPTEIKASINGIKTFYNNPLVIFQPHTYSRTLTLMEEFIEVLQGLDNLILYKTYSAREKELVGGRAIDLFDKIQHSCSYVDDVDNLINLVSSLDNFTFDCVVVLGAGDLADKLKSYLSRHN